MNPQYYLFVLLFYFTCKFETNLTEKVTYIVGERPQIVFYDTKYIRNASTSSFRHSRKDPLYYLNIYVETLVTLGNNVTLDIFFYQLQGNKYIRTFVEMHFKLCDFINNAFIFGETMKRASANQTCPFKPAEYYFSNLNLQLNEIPKSFPYRQGRMVAKSFVSQNGVNSKLTESYIDLEVKVTNKVVK